MAKPLAASKKMMKNYLAELLTEEVKPEEQPSLAAEKTVEEQKLEQLLQNVTAKLDVADINTTITSVKSQAKHETRHVTATEVGGERQEQTPTSTKKHRYQEESFQAMYFEIAGLIVAVPLIELGGIHNLDKVTPLLGKPEWFEGVMVHRDDKISVVDTARWVMPEKYDQSLNDSLNYQYVIMLNNSNWGLMAEQLVDTVTLSPDEVKWLETSDKRPWLAGLVKNKMCALIDVEALIQLLNDGANVNQAK